MNIETEKNYAYNYTGFPFILSISYSISGWNFSIDI